MDRKEEILDSAEALVRARGFDGFSYADIERDVGIRKASVHHHFASKAELGLALIRRYRARFAETLDGLRTDAQTAAGELSAYLDVYRHAMAGGKTVCLCVALSSDRDSLSDQVLRELNRFHDESIVWLEALFQRARDDGSIANVSDPRSEATASLALVEGAQLIARAAENTARFEAAVAGLRARAA